MSEVRARQSDRSLAKREQILDGAVSVFREVGYERASVDSIAARAGVSKATIYNHFRDKSALFLATVELENREIRGKFLALLETPTGDIQADLRRIGELLARLVTSPSNVLRHRIVTAEAGRFPELGRSLYECSILAARRRMATFFERAAALGLLEVPEPMHAAIDFGALCVENPLRMLLLGVEEEATEEMIAREVERAVRTFLRAYRPS
ncbi:TetR/AcrR family transcriptional regulator [Vulgatibacter incomptus]|uniref:Transcriptional regulator, TetR family n=1 Tax=Vulgatibacter incomptus TaxID=1391653 RepID=A0A0K1PIF8_9BACT|nr:TetR/AcrR family transcriptional regulator [Vulgatibacter incomptus]AKU93196.1 Transcriptional regulator, TetR family [Vulgatibacter incomptus]